MNDIVERLKEIANPEPGKAIALDVGSGTVFQAYEKYLVSACSDALAEIERLRAQVTDLTRLAGCAAVGKEFAETKRDIARQNAAMGVSDGEISNA